GFSNTEVQLNGRLSGLPEASKLNYNLHIAKLQSSRNDLNPLLPKSLQQQIRIPDRFGISGQAAGTTKDYNTNLLLMSSDGSAYINGLLSMSGGKGHERFDMHLRTDRLNIGRILRKDSLMGTVTATIVAKGQSFDVKTMTAALNGDIESATLKGYTYHQIIFNGNVAAKKGNIKLTSSDPNIRINLNGHADFSGKYAAAKFKLQMDSINFQALKLYQSELRIHGTITADFPVLNPDYPQGTFMWTEPIIVADGKKYLPDSMYISSHPNQDTGQNIVIFTDVMKGSITGHTPLTKIGAIIQDHINRHYAFKKTDSTAKSATYVAKATTRTKDSSTKVPANYDLKVVAHIEDKPLLHVVLPGLVSMDTVNVNAELDPANLYLKINAPLVVYGGNTITNANVQVNGADSAFTYQVTVDRFEQSRLQFWYANIHGNLDQNQITTDVSLSDSSKKERFALAATIQKDRDTNIVQLQPGLKLNYQTWQVNEPNRIVLSKGGMYIQNFQISNNNQYIKINSEQARPNTPLRVDISNFVLANLAQMVSKDTTLVNGLLGGNIVLERTEPTPALTSTLQIQNLSVMGDTIGDLKVDVNHTKAEELGADIAISGKGNDVDLKGTYYLQKNNGNDFDFTLLLKALNMQTIDGVTFGKLKNSSGYLRGDLHITGTTASPLITGELHTDQLATTVVMLNSYYKMPAEKITFTKDGIDFHDFKIYDSAGNDAVITGNVNTKDLPNLTMDLHVRAKDWRAIHSTSGDNKTYYGDLLLTTNLNIKGSPSAPNVDGNLKILKGTKLTYVMPETAPQVESHEGIVKFFSMKDTARYRILRPQKKDTTKVKVAAGSNINVNVGIDKSAEFSVIIDKASGDFLKVRGDGALNASVAPDGTVGLTGTYELHGGEYQLNYNFIKRLFKIQDGSSITFAGDPSKMQANITAIYVADVAPYDLVQRDVPDPSQLNYYKERLPFNVELHIRGEVLHPSLTFNITLPDNTVFPISYDAVELVRGKLSQVRQDTAELNKQVFALLILNHFVAEDPFSSGESNSAAFIAKQSVSRFIGEQLNQFANHLIKGVDLSVDLASSEDYTTGSYRERTDLNLAASKRLLNDRLKITIGNDFELEGPQTSNSEQSTLIPSNLAADYLLTADGRYTVQAYRKNYDEGVLEGYVTETGVNFIVSLDYNKFKNIFRKKNHKKEQSTTAPKK
ncbi:MAG: translocation/assembly module TamB domain-containing protein, partial [Flavipsychrobacter sp.]